MTSSAVHIPRPAPLCHPEGGHTMSWHRLVLVFAIVLSLVADAHAQQLPRAGSPEDVGLSSERLRRLSAAFRTGVDPDTYGIPIVSSSVDFAGALTLVLTIAALGVVDAQEAALPGVTIVLTNQASGLFRQATTNDDGRYFITALTPGLYEIAAELGGFKRYTRRDVRLDLGRTTTLDVQMEIGALTEVVTVQASTPLVDLTSKEIGGNVTNREVTMLPSVNGNFVGMVALLPGIVSNVSTESFGSDAVSVNGMDSRNNNFMLDGANNNDDVIGQRAGTQARTPIEAIQTRSHVINVPPDLLASGEHFALDFSICPKDGRPAPSAVAVDAWMPAHKHGMNYKAEVKSYGGGRFYATGLMFHMPGVWQFLFDIDGARIAESIPVE